MNEDNNKKDNSILNFFIGCAIFVQASSAYAAYTNRTPEDSIYSIMLNQIGWTIVSLIEIVVIICVVQWLDKFNFLGKWTGIIYFLIVPVCFFVFLLSKGL